MKKLFKIVFFIFLFGIIGVFGIYGAAYAMGDLNLNMQQDLKIYDNQDQIFYEVSNDQASQYVQLDQISPYFLEAIVAIEDHRFYQHYGFDPIGISRAIVSNITTGSMQGGSSISMQYARLLYLNNDKTITRKIKEAFYTIRLETQLSKAEILEGYVNSLYYGHGIYGIENAAKYYYQKSAKDLNLQESCMLAGVINGPSYYSPYIDKDAAKQRQSLVLEKMLEQELINSNQYDQALDSDIVVSQTDTSHHDSQYLYYKDLVLQELDQIGIDQALIESGGLSIYTTFSKQHQDELIKNTFNHTSDTKIQSASIIVEPYTSKILALMGGNDYTTSQYNRTTLASRQIGSTIKPLLYYLALENGFDPNTSFRIEPTKFKLSNHQIYAPGNYDNKYPYDEVTLAQAIAVSDNIYAVKTHLFLGEEMLVDFLKQFDFDVNPDASLALGTLNTNMYELANIYNVFASEGKYQPIYAIETIVDKNGDVIYEHQEKSKQILNKESCLVLNQLLTGTFDDQFNTYLTSTMSSYHLDSIYAAKTGTTDFDSIAVVYNPSILMTSWVGFDDNAPLELANDRYICKEIVIDTIKSTKDVESFQWYKPTKNIIEEKINPLKGIKDKKGTIYWFKKNQ